MISVGDVFGNYKVLLQLRPGAQGYVYVVENVKTKLHSAMKVVFAEESPQKDIEEMIGNWKKFCSSKEKQHFVEYQEHFYEKNQCFILMEFCEDGDLETTIKKHLKEKTKFTEEKVLKALIDGMKGLKVMHDLHCMHRDIKSANMLIGKDGKFKLCDFGTARSMGGTNVGKTLIGTMEYNAPEIQSGEEYTYSVDVFSLGAVIYEMIMGKTPFVNERGVVAMRNLLNGKYEAIPTNLGYSIPLVETIHACLSLSPSSRPSPAEVLTSSFVMQTVLWDMEQRCAAAEERAGAAEREAKQANERAGAAEREAELAKGIAATAESAVRELRKEFAGLRSAMAASAPSSSPSPLSSSSSSSPSLQSLSRTAPPSTQQPKPTALAALTPNTAVALSGNGYENLPLRFMANATADRSIFLSHTKAVWGGKDSNATYVVDREIVKGLYRLEIEAANSVTKSMVSIYVGLCSKATYFSKDLNAAEFHTGASFFHYCGVYCGKRRDAVPGLFSDAPKHLFGMELDADRGILSLFVDGVLIPHTVVGVPKPVYFAIYGYHNGTCFTLLSLRRLSSSSPCLQCTPHQWQ